MAQEFLATAFVQIKPQIRGFKTQLQRDLKTALSGVSAFVKVTPDIGPFRDQIRAQLGKAPIPVLVEPDTTGFREKLLAETKDLKVTIPVEGGVSQGGGAGAGGTSGGAAATERSAKRIATVQEAQIAIRNRLREATNFLTLAEDKNLTIEERSAAARQAANRVNRAFTESIELSGRSQAKSTAALRADVSERFKRVASVREDIAITQKGADVSEDVRKAQDALRIAEEKRVLALRGVTNALSPLQAAQITATRSATALARAEAAHDLAIKSGSVALQKATRETFLLAEAQNAEAASALRAAKAQAAHARTLAAVNKAGLASAAGFLGLRGAVLTAGTAFIGATVAFQSFVKSVQLAAGFERELNVFRVTADATAQEMEQISETAKQLGADITLPAVSAGDAASAMTQLAKAGLDVQDSMDAARGVLQLATAAQIENVEATTLVASALNAFGLAGTESVRVADLLAGSANESQGSIVDMGVALQQASAAARQAGISIEDTVAILTLLARNGVRGSDAGTSLRTAIIRLVNPTKRARDRLRDLNVQIRDVEGNIRPEVFAELTDKLSELGAAGRDRAIAQIFGQDAFRAASILGREGTEGLNAMRISTQEAGVAAEVAGAQTEGFGGKVEGLKNNLETLGTTLGELSLPILGGFVGILNVTTKVLNIAAQQAKDSAEAIADSFREISAPVEDAGDAVGGFLGRFVDFAKEDIFGPDVPDTIRDTQKQVDQLLKTLQSAGGGPSAINDFVFALKAIVGDLRNGDKEAQALAETIDKLIKKVQDVGEISPQQFRELFSNLQPEVERSAKEGAEIFKLMFKNVLTPEAGRTIGIPFFEGIASAAGDVQPIQATGLTAKQLLGRISGFEAEQVRAELRGGSESLLSVLEAERAFLENALQNNAAVRNQIGIRRAIEKALLGVEDEIATIQDRAQSERERSARERERRREESEREAQRALEEADRATVGRFERRREDTEGRLLVAEATEGLKDDIKLNKQLRSLLRIQNRRAKERIRDLETRREFIRENNRRIIQITLEIRDLEKQQRDALREQEADRREQVREGLRLDIEFGEITENRNFEIRARRRLIASLNRELAALQAIKKKSQEQKNRIKEIRNEIAGEKKAIRELRDEAEDRNDEFRRLLFEQLQAQQGFTANLLSNLFPSGAAAGALGSSLPVSGAQVFQPIPGVPGPGDRVTQTAGLATSRDRDGFSQSQASTLVELTRRLLEEIRALRLGQSHPSSKHQRHRGKVAMDATDTF